MTINFRRNALQLSVAALFSSAFMANAADVTQVKVTVFRTIARRRWSGRSSKA